MQFNPRFNSAYVLNPLLSTMTVFGVNFELLQGIKDARDRKEDMGQFQDCSTLHFIQTVYTIPSHFPAELNTCKEMCLHPSGRFVLVSNHGHHSIAVFRAAAELDHLVLVDYSYMLHGQAPGHVQFDVTTGLVEFANNNKATTAIQALLCTEKLAEIDTTGPGHFQFDVT
jgi:6-phosphogluconolactonase (cycloisomerase 2 family)